MKKFAIIISFEEKQCIWTKNTESLRVMSDENQPLLGGEHYLTDRELHREDWLRSSPNTQEISMLHSLAQSLPFGENKKS